MRSKKSFLEQYLADRAPNIPQSVDFDALRAATSDMLSDAIVDSQDILNALYCLDEGVIDPSDLPADMVAI